MNRLLASTILCTLLISTCCAHLNASADDMPTLSTETNTPAMAQEGHVSTTETPVTTQTVPQAAAQPVMTAPVLTGADYFTMHRVKTKLSNVSNRKYDAYEMTLTNTQPYHVQVLSGNITNALSEQQITAQAHNKKKRGFGFGKMALGALSVAAHAGGMAGLHGGGGASAMLAAARAQQVAGVAQHALYNANMISNNADGSISLTGSYTQQFKDVLLGQNQDFKFQVIVPHGQVPQLQMVFKNLETNQILDVKQAI